MPERAAAAAATTGARALTDYRELFGQVDAVTSRCRPSVHHEIALPFLQRGVAVLVEKPMHAYARGSRRAARGRARVGRDARRSATPSATTRRSPR